MIEIDTSTEAVEAMLECLMGPWQVCMVRDNYGTTGYHIRTHSHTAITVDPRGYFPEGYTPPVDDDGYYQPDDVMVCPSWRIDIARFIAASRQMVPALLKERDQLRDELDAAYAIIAAERGEVIKLREALSKKDQANDC